MYPFNYEIKLSSGVYTVKAFDLDSAIILAQAQAIKEGKTYELVDETLKLKPKEVQGLEMTWELLKSELEQLADFYDRCQSTDSMNIIQDVQDLMTKLENGEF